MHARTGAIAVAIASSESPKSKTKTTGYLGTPRRLIRHIQLLGITLMLTVIGSRRRRTDVREELLGALKDGGAAL